MRKEAPLDTIVVLSAPGHTTAVLEAEAEAVAEVVELPIDDAVEIELEVCNLAPQI